MHLFIHFDLNGTIIAGDEKGGKSPNKSILSDLLENYEIESSDKFLESLQLTQLSQILNQQLGTNLDFTHLIETHKSAYKCTNFYDNFKILLKLCISEANAPVKENDLVKHFLQTDKNPDNSLKGMLVEQILADKTKMEQFKSQLSAFRQHIDDENIVLAFYEFIKTIKHDTYTHVILNTFGSEAPKVVDKIKKEINCEQSFNLAESSSTDKSKIAQEIFNAASQSRLITQVSNFQHYDTNGRVNKSGKLFPINSSKRGLYIFFDDNLSFGTTEEKGCVNIYDIEAQLDVDFTNQIDCTAQDEIPEIKAVCCGKAIVVLVRARLIQTCEKDYFSHVIQRYKSLAMSYYNQEQTERSNSNSFYQNPTGSESKISTQQNDSLTM